MDKIEELGFEAGVAALFALGGDISVPAAVLIPLSTKAIDDGIKHMGLHPAISAAIAGCFKITTYGKILWNIKRDAFYTPFKELLAERVSGLRAYKLIDENWQDTRAKFAKEAGAQASLDDAHDFLRKKAIEESIQVGEANR